MAMLSTDIWRVCIRCAMHGHLSGPPPQQCLYAILVYIHQLQLVS